MSAFIPLDEVDHAHCAWIRLGGVEEVEEDQRNEEECGRGQPGASFRIFVDDDIRTNLGQKLTYLFFSTIKRFPAAFVLFPSLYTPARICV